ncbi:hypothetical protein PRUPE_6G134000 [Prunus persica]|uniref:NAC domain-containing protein n=1 Tax=Prunus persica TaxID=3760 RepID=M5W7Q2_PRUPE|nr:hypothetical protein PRUPE_6G133600 [Prunus persica]ONI01337.1 hypothetical protein PRUPE_6G134000 [Prunus persica]
MAEDGYAYDRVPPGYHFCPSEQELLLYYLRPKVNAEEVPGENHVVFDFNLYSDQPRKIWDHFQTTRQNDLKMSNDLYLFTELQTKTTNGSRVSRTVGSGTWKGEDGGKKICAPGTDHVIGIKKRFRYENKGSAEHGKWLMNEFELGQSLIHNRQAKKYVLCLLRKKEEPEKKRKEPEEEDRRQVLCLQTQEKRQRMLPCIDNLPPPHPQPQPLENYAFVAELPVTQSLKPWIDNSPPLAAQVQDENLGQELLTSCVDFVPSFASEELSILEWDERLWEPFVLQSVDDVPEPVAVGTTMQGAENEVIYTASTSALPIDCTGHTATQADNPQSNVFGGLGGLDDSFNCTPWINSVEGEPASGINTTEEDNLRQS